MSICTVCSYFHRAGRWHGDGPQSIFFFFRFSCGHGAVKDEAIRYMFQSNIDVNALGVNLKIHRNVWPGFHSFLIKVIDINEIHIITIVPQFPRSLKVIFPYIITWFFNTSVVESTRYTP